MADDKRFPSPFSDPEGLGQKSVPAAEAVSDGEGGRQVVLIDTSVEGYEALLAGVSPEAEVVLLDGADGLAGLAEALAGLTNVQSLALLSHGDQGAVAIGEETLSGDTLDDHTGLLAALKAAMTESGDILLYGCRVGEGGEGRAFLEELARATGADVAASDDLTGSAALGGDWDLEARVGSVEPYFGFEGGSVSFDALLGPSAGTISWTNSGTVTNSGADQQDPSISDVDSVGFDVTLNTTGGNGGTIVVQNAGSFGDGGESGSDPTIQFMVDAGSGTVLDDIRFESSDGANFQLDSLVVGNTTTAGVTITFEGYRDGGGSAVATTTYETTSNSLGNQTTGNGTVTFDSDWEDIDEIRISVSPNTGGTIDTIGFDDIVITTAVASNTTPTISIDNSTLAYTENATAVQIDSAGTVSDSDGDSDWDGGTLEVQITGSAESSDQISISDTDGDGTAITVSGSNIFANAVDIGDLSTSGGTVTGGTALTITFDSDATNANVQEVLQSLRYESTSEDPGTSNRTITITAADSSAASASDTRTVSVTAVNDEPTLTATGSDPTFTEDGSAAVLFSTASASTVESGQTIAGFTLTVSNVNDGSDETLSIDGTSIALTNANSGTTTGGNSLSYSVAVSSNTATVTISGGTLSTGDAESIIEAISYSNASDDPDTSNRVVTITSITDSGSNTGDNDNVAALSISSTVTVNAVNDEPTLTATGSDPTFTEDGSAAVLFSTASASTVESGQTIAGFTLTVSNVNDGSDETLSIDGTSIALTNANSGTTTGGNSLSYSVAVSSNTATVTISGGTLSTGDAESIIEAISYSNASDDPDTSNRVVTITSITDSGSNTGSNDNVAALSISSTVTVNAVNDEPTLTATGSDPTFTEDGSAAVLFSTASASTVESGQTIAGFTLTVSNVNDGSDETLSIDGTSIALTNANSGTTTGGNSLSYSVAVSSNTATVTISGGTLSTGDAESIIEAISYSNASDDPDTSNRVVTITSITDSGSNTGDNDNVAALSISSTVTVNAENDAPELGNVDGDSFTYTEGDGNTDIDVSGDATVSDVDSTNFDGGTLTVSYDSGQQSEDRLVIDTSGTVGVSGSTVSVSGTDIGTIQGGSEGGSGEDLQISLNSSATPSNVQTLLRAIQYSNQGGDVPTDGNRVLDIVLTDGDGGTSSTASVTINVDPENDDPEFTGLNGAPSFTEDGSAVTLDSDVTVSDAELDDADDFSGASLTIARNGGADSDDDFDFDTSGASFTVSGGNLQSGGLTFATFTDTSGTLTISFTSSGTAATGALVDDVLQRITYENTSDAPDASAQLDWTFSDGTGNDTGSTTVTITATNDAPVLDDSQSPTLTGIDEDAGDDDGDGGDGDDDATDDDNNSGTLVSDIVVDSSITDDDGSAVESIAVTVVDNTNGLWQYSTDGSTWNNFSGTTGSSQDISANAVLLESDDFVRFVPGADFQSTATFTFRAWDESDGGSGGDTLDGSSGGGSSSLSSATDTASVSVSGVNDAPEFSGLDDTPTFTEEGSAVTLDDDVTVADVELDSIDDFSGAILTISRNGGADSDDELAVASGGSLTVAGGPNGGGTITASSNVIATISDAGDDDELTITFADNGTTPTGALVDEVLQAITYSNSSDDPGSSVQLDWAFSDGNSGDAQGSGDNPASGSGSITVSITEVNDAPTLSATGGNPTFTEGGSASDLYNTVVASTVEAGQTITAMTLTVTNVSDGADETLSVDGSTIELTNGFSDGNTDTNGLDVDVSVSGSVATVSFSGATLSTAQFQTLVDGLAYENTSDNPTTSGNRVVTITGITDSGGTDDGGVESAAPNIVSTVSITAVNDAPAVGNVDGETSSVVAGSGATNVDLFDDATVTNADSTDYNGGFLTIGQDTGTTNGSWSFDGTNVTSGGDGTVSAGETVQVGGTTVGTIDATDDGQGGNDFTINFTTANATSANIQTLLQNLEFSGPSGIDSRTFTLTLNDGDGTDDSGDEDTTAGFTVSVTPNPPVLGNLDGDSLTFTEGDSATALDASGDATVTDADSTDFDGGDLTISITANQAADDRLEIDTSGSVSLSAGQTAGSTVSVSGTGIGTIDSGATGGENEDLIISLDSDATPSLVQTLLRAIQYNNAGGDNPTDGDRTITVTLSDGDGATSSDAEITVDVDPENDNPTASLPDDVDATEDTASNIDLTSADFSDDDSSSITVTLTANEGTFSTPADGDGDGVTETLVSSTVITLVGAPDDIDTYLDTASNIQYTGATNDNGDNVSTITVQANDGDGSGDVTLGTVNVDIAAVNDLPTSSGGSFNLTTNGSRTLTASRFNFSDVDSGDSLSSVRIDTLPASGTISLSGTAISASDVIAVADLTNLTYRAASSSGNTSFTYSVNDGTGFATAPATMSISVSAPAPTNSPPNAPLLSGRSVAENKTGAAIGTISAVDPNGDPVTLSVSDSRFVVSGSTLKLKAGQSLDFETEPTVALTITATDTSGASSSSSFTILVTDVKEQVGTDGNDTIDGGDDDDEVLSGAGNDVIRTANGKDTIDGGDGDDDVDGGNDDDFLNGGAGDDTVAGGSGEDTMRGGEGNDTVSSGDGNDLVYAGPGDEGSDVVTGAEGNDSLGGGAGNDLIQGEDNDDLIWGRFGADTVDGGSGEDELYNGEGDDTVFGGTGDDTLWGGEGDDMLSGGEGSDVFTFGAQVGNDQITDFEVGEDEIDFQYSGTGFETVADVTAVSTEATVDGISGVLIQLAEDKSIFLQGLTLDDLNSVDFIF